jgi:hypothetical protein
MELQLSVRRGCPVNTAVAALLPRYLVTRGAIVPVTVEVAEAAATAAVFEEVSFPTCRMPSNSRRE